MLRQVPEGVLIHESGFCQSNAVVVQGREVVLIIDPGVRSSEMACLAKDLSDAGRTVVAGFSTHPIGIICSGIPRSARRPGTAPRAVPLPPGTGCPAGWMPSQRRPGVPEVPLDLLGLITGLPAGMAQIPWDGPDVRILEHQAHAPGHAALLIEGCGVLVVGDMLSDVLIPMLDLNGTADPIADYLDALRLLEGVAGDVDVLIPGHGSVGGADQVRVRIDPDREHVNALKTARVPSDPRTGPSARPAGYGWAACMIVNSGSSPNEAKATEFPASGYSAGT